MTAPQPDTETLVAIVREALNDSDDGDPTMYAQKAISALDALAARLAEAEAERDAEREAHDLALDELRMLVVGAEHDSEALSRRVAELEAERDEANTELHSLRWILGLDTHEGEEPQPEEASVENLRKLLAALDPAASQPAQPDEEAER